MTSTNQSQQLLSLGDKPVLGTFLEEKLVPGHWLHWALSTDVARRVLDFSPKTLPPTQP